MKKINESFECINCKTSVQPAQKTCRNHCPRCFTSLHVDGSIPGDRSGNCFGIMYPETYYVSNGTIKILFKCKKCGKTHNNKVATDDDIGNLDFFVKKYKEYLSI